MDNIILEFAKQLPTGLNSMLTVALCFIVWRFDRQLQLMTVQLRVLIEGSHINIMRAGE